MDFYPIKNKIANYNSKSVNAEISHKIAAVIVLLLISKREISLLLQIRSEHLKYHPGEIGFTGGTKEEIDDNLIDTAYRETEEEIGVLRKDIELIGDLDAVLTSTLFLIKPYVGIINKKPEFDLSSEVAKIVNVPLTELNNHINWRYDYIITKKSLKKFRTFYYDGNIIFGATAKIINNLLNILNK